MGTMRGIGVALRNRVDSDVRCGECSEGEEVADCCGGYITQRHELLGGRSETAFQKK